MGHRRATPTTLMVIPDQVADRRIHTPQKYLIPPDTHPQNAQEVKENVSFHNLYKHESSLRGVKCKKEDPHHLDRAKGEARLQEWNHHSYDIRLERAKAPLEQQRRLGLAHFFATPANGTGFERNIEARTFATTTPSDWRHYGTGLRAHMPIEGSKLDYSGLSSSSLSLSLLRVPSVPPDLGNTNIRYNHTLRAITPISTTRPPGIASLEPPILRNTLTVILHAWLRIHHNVFERYAPASPTKFLSYVTPRNPIFHLLPPYVFQIHGTPKDRLVFTKIITVPEPSTSFASHDHSVVCKQAPPPCPDPKPCPTIPEQG